MNTTFSLGSGHEVVVRMNAVGQWTMSVWAADKTIGSDYGPGPMPGRGFLAERAERVVFNAHRWDAIGV